MRRFLAILIATIVAIPAAGATWMSYGTYEPDTKYDQNGPMWPNANTTAGSKAIYFNVYQTVTGAGMSMNAGVIGTRQVQPGSQNFNALLGPWLDCNADDYVGLAESALLVYPSSVLQALGASRCPVGSTQNDGDWVYEYRPIGHDPTEVPQTLHPMQIDDEQALVWGDAGVPGSAARGSCPITPFPHGTTSGTGWMIRYGDCYTAYRVQKTVNANDPTPGRQLAWDCPTGTTNCEGNPQKSDSLLNQQLPESLFGNPETGETGALQLDSEEDGGNEEAAFTTWDCSSRSAEFNDNLFRFEETVGPVRIGSRGYAIEDPTYDDAEQNGLITGNYRYEDENFTDSDGTYAWAARPAPAVIEPRHSWADGLNQTFRGFRVGGADENRDTAVGGDCNTDPEPETPSQGDGEDGENTYSSLHQNLGNADADFEPPSQTGKKEADQAFFYWNGDEQEGIEADLFGPNTPTLVAAAPPQNFWFAPGWFGLGGWVTLPQAINRQSLDPESPLYWSFYAKVNVTGLTAKGYAFPPGANKYGSETCGSETTGIHNGWDCLSSHWYTDSNFQPIVDGDEVWAARVGYPYQFRDVDCNDGSVARGAGVFASLVQFSPGTDEDRDPSTPNTTTCKDSTL